MSKTYTYSDEYGYEEPFEADDMHEACEIAEDMARGGEWGDEGASVSVWVTEKDEDGDVTDQRSITVEIEPDHEALIHHATSAARERSCGDSPDDHDWTREGEGGCDSNPGVWSTGGTSMLFCSHCRTCGLHRKTSTCGSQRNPGDHDTTEYEMPSQWCEDCQSDECEC